MIRFSMLGGLKTFGAPGVFIGPLVLAITVALFRFLREVCTESQSANAIGRWSI
jgi:predicted PurR-regulated permease PerM